MTAGPAFARRAFFLEGSRGGRFCLSTEARAPRGALLYVHPFAEEMNKSRRMAALGAATFAARGWSVLQIDLLGCGDSAGDFGDARWGDWIDDLESAFDWLAQRHAGPVVVWALRAGALLAADWLAGRKHDLPLLLWQPVSSGRQHLTHFLRLKAANEMLSAADAREAMAKIRAELQSGGAVEIAGYLLDPGLASSLEQASVELREGYRGRVAVFEIQSGAASTVSPAAAALVARWQDRGLDASAEAIEGPAFWQTQEIEIAPALITHSCDWLDGVAS